MTRCAAKDAMKAVTRCGRLLSLDPPAADEAWKIVEPFITCEEFDGPSLLSRETMIQMILATAADAKRELGHVHEAAFLYSEALRYDGGFLGFADFYAQMVVEHDLQDHRQPAFDAVRRQEDLWRSRSWLYKSSCWLAWIVFILPRHPRVWRAYRDGKRGAQLLKQQMQPYEGSC